MKYFAYGSNMLPTWLRMRVPSATLIGTAVLHGHTLRWHKRSVDESGKCDAFFTGEVTDEVFGVLYEIPRREKPALDEAEGAGEGYEECQVTVRVGATPTEAFTYTARPIAIDNSLTPYDWYKALVLAVARRHGLPVQYVSRIEAQPSKPDEDVPRRGKALAALGDSDNQ